MKKQLSIRSLKYLGVSAIVAASINLGTQAQPRPMKETSTFETMERLEEFMTNSAGSLKYQAPDEFSSAAEQENAMNDLNIFASNKVTEIKYTAPQEFVDPTVRDHKKRTHKPVNVEVYRTPNEQWLIKAGYYKSSRTPAWTNVRKSFSRTDRQQLASQD